MAELPSEIIIKILSHLPVKSLFRFKCVCKTWQSLIKTPTLIKSHLNQALISSSDFHLLVSVDHSSLHFFQLDRLSSSFSKPSKAYNPLTPKPFNVVGTCNGVVCTSNLSKTTVVLFNPLTNSHRKLPSNGFPSSTLNLTVFGFGYDRQNDDYKVLKIVQGLGKMEDSTNKAQVYSLKNDSWKCIQGIPYHLYYGYYDGVLVSEGLHYVVTQQSYSDCLFIAKFDVRNETFSVMDCPNYDDKFKTDSMKTVFMLAELSGCLCLLINHYGCDDLDEYDHDSDLDLDLDDELESRVLEHVELWVMTEYGNKESWVKLLSIRKPEDIGSYKFVRTLVYSNDGSKILLEIDGSGYCWYDLETKTVERITAHRLPNANLKTGLFMGSLVSIEDKKVLSEKETLPRENRKKNARDDFLSTGFKLKL